MKVGIYIDGLGQSVTSESLVSYSTRLKNEYDYHKTGVTHELKVEKIKYADNRESNVASIIEHNGANEMVLYKLYEFRYGDIMTGDYKKRNILLKNVFLFALVIKKFPLVIGRFFVKKNYARPFQTFYIFSLFFIIALAILFMIPAIITVISNFFLEAPVKDFVHAHPWILAISRFLHINNNNLKSFSEFFVSVISIILLLAPQANVIITSLATEFVCAHNYLQFGQQNQDIQGNLDQLVEYIAEHEAEPKIHIHAYSYGTLIAIDYLFPYGTTPSGNKLELTEALITIGTPFDFISSYYADYYLERSKAMENKIRWLNVYSIADALASNFRKDEMPGEAQYGISNDGLKPLNVNYEVVKINQYNLSNFISLNSLKAHGMYWSSTTNGASCLHPIYLKMKAEGLI
jgi:hypothetical protein